LSLNKRSSQTSEAGVSHPSGEYLRALIALYLADGGLAVGRGFAEAMAPDPSAQTPLQLPVVEPTV
jgi:hypothetical protein